jgi:large subunit ribosomal protein L18|tara:strand:+ start:1811 stop:2161 length:351 start_codon:yes stop_codon:yes gene_type:complete
MSINKEKRRLKIRKNIRSKIFGTGERPRVSIFKSNKAIYSQIIDDLSGNTIVSCSSVEIKKFGKNNIESSKEVGLKLAEKAKKKGIKEVLFDRGGYLYHGKIKSFAEGAREGGLIF